MKHRICGKLAALTLVSTVLLALPSLADEVEKPKPVNAAVALEKDNYRVANFVVACYSIGKAAVHGEEGVLHVSMLVRYKPFREWIAVYYDPKLITEEKLGDYLRERRCGSAKLEREESSPLTVMNRIVGIGDLVQLRISAGGTSSIKKVALPEGWKLVGEPSGTRDSSGVTYLTVRVPAKEKFATYSILLHPNEGDPLKAEVEVVNKMR
ncbi:MAG: hypothetical protein AB8D78_14310 [Akkermansiaceae bacterium]